MSAYPSSTAKPRVRRGVWRLIALGTAGLLSCSVLGVSGAGSRNEKASVEYRRALNDFHQVRNLERARAAFETIARTYPSYAPPHLNLALLAEARGDLETAEAELSKFIQLSPGSRYLGNARAELAKVKDWSSLAKVDSGESESFKVTIRAAYEALNRGDPHQALVALSEDKGKQALHWQTSCFTAFAFYQQGQGESALGALAQSLRIAPEEKQKALRRIYASIAKKVTFEFLKARETQRAYKVAQAAHEQNPPRDDLAYVAGLLALSTGHERQAGDLLSRLQHSPDPGVASNSQIMVARLSRKR